MEFWDSAWLVGRSTTAINGLTAAGFNPPSHYDIVMTGRTSLPIRSTLLLSRLYTLTFYSLALSLRAIVRIIGALILHSIFRTRDTPSWKRMVALRSSPNS